MKKINKKIFPEDFFDLPNNKEELSNIKNKSKQKEHPKLINPSNTIKVVPPEFNEIKEEAFEESVENIQVKKNNLKIIIPDLIQIRMKILIRLQPILLMRKIIIINQ